MCGDKGFMRKSVLSFQSCCESKNVLKIFWIVLGLHCSAQASRCSGFSCRRAQALEHTGFSICITWAQ